VSTPAPGAGPSSQGSPAAPVRLTLATAWRAAATGFCFAAFGLGQLLLAATLFPLLVLLVRNERERIRLGRQIVNRAFRLFVSLMSLMGVLRYRVRGRERLNQPGTLIIANHPSLIDVVFLISFVPEADCVVKASLFTNPFTRYALLAAGYIPSHRDPEQVLSACRASLRAGGILIVFPEGTRSEPGQPLCFKRGAANLAVRLGCDIVPVVIRVGEHNLGKRCRWWRVPARRMPYDFEVKERLDVAPWRKAGQEPAIAARELTAFLTDYFGREVRTPCPSWLPRLNN
jgi:1-acyl-sn-glycerol-3-phosphate acyltransferase